MWCGTCQSDVVTEVASDHRRVSCSICGATLGETAASQEGSEAASPRTEKTTQARELLERWAKSPLFDPYAPGQKPAGSADPAAIETATADPASQAASAETTPESVATAPTVTHGTGGTDATDGTGAGKSEELDRLTEEILARVARITESIRQPEESPSSLRDENRGPGFQPVGQTEDRLEARPTEGEGADSESRSETEWRVDAGHAPAASTDTPPPGTKTFDAAGNPISDRPDGGRFEEPAPQRVDTAHSQASVPAPHTTFAQPAPASLSSPPKKSGFVGGIGQVLAYFGILGLTAGTSLVIVGYFGGPVHYAPTGWLVSTIGQMMLFLGVVTLVSTGMEQTQAEVRESLDESLREVSSRIDQLGQRLTRIDASAHETPPPPHVQTTPANGHILPSAKYQSDHTAQ